MPDLDSLTKQAVVAKKMGAVLINVHGGRDAWYSDSALTLISGVAELEQQLGIPCVFETHRQRLFWNPWQTVTPPSLSHLHPLLLT